MIIFDRLCLSNNGKTMYINAHINTASYFTNVYIDTITIMTADKVSETSPETPTSDFIYSKQISGNIKEVALVLNSSDFIGVTADSMQKTLFFVYIKTKGIPSIDTPCGLDIATTVGITFNEKLLYQRTMEYTKELVNNCTISKGFVDFILLWNSFKAAIETAHYISGIKFYNMLFNILEDGNYSITKSSCGCYG